MTKSRQALGRWGENLAADYLARRGYAILGQNVRTPYGEIDLVAQQETRAGPVTVFVEVKTRSSTAYGLPEDAIDRRKRDHLLSAAQHHLMEHPELSGDWRVDVVAIRRFRSKRSPQITHFENALSE